jgi:hypothetical protein
MPRSRDGDRAHAGDDAGRRHPLKARAGWPKSAGKLRTDPLEPRQRPRLGGMRVHRRRLRRRGAAGALRALAARLRGEKQEAIATGVPSARSPRRRASCIRAISASASPDFSVCRPILSASGRSTPTTQLAPLISIATRQRAGHDGLRRSGRSSHGSPSGLSYLRWRFAIPTMPPSAAHS